MNLNLKGLRKSPFWKRNLTGYILLDGVKLMDCKVRLIIEKGIENGYKTLQDIPDEIARQWLNEQSK